MNSSIYIKKSEKISRDNGKTKDKILVMATAIAIAAVDSLVSNTSVSNTMSVCADSYRHRLRIQNRVSVGSESEGSLCFPSSPARTLTQTQIMFDFEKLDVHQRPKP